MNRIVVAIGIFAATAVKAESITEDEARSFGFEIIHDARCLTNYAKPDLAKWLNRGATMNDIRAKKDAIIYGKHLAESDLSKKGTMAFCVNATQKPVPKLSHEDTVRTIGFEEAEDQICGTHNYERALKSMIKAGEIYPGELKDYAKEFQDGRRTALRAVENEGETKYCRVDREIERKRKDFERITRALGIYETPADSWRNRPVP